MRSEGYLARIFETHSLSQQMGVRIHRRCAAAALLSWAALVLALTHHLSIAECVLVFIPLFFLMGLVNMASRGMTVLSSAQLDERMRAVRDGAHRHAYVIGVIAAFAFGVYFGYDDATRLAEGWRIAFQLGAVSLLVLGLPAMILAWQLPEEPLQS
jgi:MFS family permease